MLAQLSNAEAQESSFLLQQRLEITVAAFSDIARFVSVLPQLTPATELGAAAVAAYAAREGLDVPAFLATRGPVLTPDQVGRAILDLVCDPALSHPSYLLSAAGLSELQ